MHVNWSRPAPWVFVGFGIEAIGVGIIALQHDEGGLGGFVVLTGVVVTTIALVAYLVARARRAVTTAETPEQLGTDDSA